MKIVECSDVLLAIEFLSCERAGKFILENSKDKGHNAMKILYVLVTSIVIHAKRWPMIDEVFFLT